MSDDRKRGGGKRPGGRGPRPQDGRRGDGPRPARFVKPGKGFPRRDTPAAPAVEQGSDGRERIAKRLARAGVSSRRDAETMIAAGRISVNGRVIDTPALNVGPADRIEIDGKPIPEIERTRLFLFHKPAGVVTTNRDPEGRRTVFDVLPKGLPRLMTVGRLDINTEGLLLLTNDGGLARLLELPTTGWLRRYRVRVHGKVDPRALEGLKGGIAVDGHFYGAIEAALEREQGSNAWLTMALREGKNREVKNVLGALGLDVTRLIRVSFGPFQLGELDEGAVLELKGRTLREQLGERLIEESGANFEAPVTMPFSNKPVTAAAERREENSEKPARPDRPFRRDKEHRRENALDRLQTRPDRSLNRGQRSGEKDEVRRTRNANVWMAPGARPTRRKDETADEGAGPPPEGRGRGPMRDRPDRPERVRSERDGRPRQGGPRAARSRDEARPKGAGRDRDAESRPRGENGTDRPRREGGERGRDWPPRDGFGKRAHSSGEDGSGGAYAERADRSTDKARPRKPGPGRSGPPKGRPHGAGGGKPGSGRRGSEKPGPGRPASGKPGRGGSGAGSAPRSGPRKGPRGR